MQAEQYLIHGKTHRYWWSWIAAWPSSQDDRRYRVLRHVFADHTTNAKSGGSWLGAYNEGNELHQVLGVFENFSIFPDYEWAEQFLDISGVEYRRPVRFASWQYELRGRGGTRDSHIDIALKVEDSHEGENRIAIVVEAKRRSGPLAKKDLENPHPYLGNHHLAGFRRKAMVFIVDQDDLARLPSHVTHRVTWQQTYKIQMDQVLRLDASPEAKVEVRRKLNAYLRWFSEDWHLTRSKLERAMEFPSPQLTSERVAMFLLGLDTVIDARLRRPLHGIPEWLVREKTIDAYAGARELKTSEFDEAVW